MKKAPLFALAAAALMFTGLSPAFAGDRDSFSFSVRVGDGPHGYYDRDYDRRGYGHEQHRWEHRHRHHDRDCDRHHGYRTYYERPPYAPHGRVVVVERPYRGYRDRW